MDRRRFLGVGAGFTAGLAGLGPMAGGAAARPPRIRRYVKLGTTGLEVSDISFGSSRSSDPDLVRHAADRGVTYFDTAESYRGGRAEEAIGEALSGRRDRFVIASKHKAWSGETRESMMTALEGSLRRLRTDWVDIYYNHAVNDLRRLQNPEWREFTDRAIRDGKIRYRGVSGHGSNLAECLDHALDHDLADVILAAYNFAEDASFFERMRARFHFVAPQTGLSRVHSRAAGKGVGVLAMKTLMGARLNDMRPHESGGATFAQAAFRWVLSSPHVDGVVISMTDTAAIDEYVAASGGARNRARASSACSDATPSSRARATAGPAAMPARRPVRPGWKSPRCCGPGCTKSTTATRSSPVRTTPPSAREAAARAFPATERPASAPVRPAFPVAGFTRDAALRLGGAAPALA